MSFKQKEILKYVVGLNVTEKIKIQNTEETRLIFKNDEVNKLFCEFDGNILNPFKDYTYEWLYSFFNRIEETLNFEEFESFEEFENKINDLMFEWVDSEVNIYNLDLLKWVSSHLDNIYYVNEVLEEGNQKDFINVLQIAQYKEIEEIFNNAFSVLLEELKNRFEE